MMRVCNKCLWPVAVASFAMTVSLMVARPAWAEATHTGMTFSWTQVIVLVGIGAAWGDMRRQVADLRKDFDDLRKKGV
jgi:hypothetical protein